MIRLVFRSYINCWYGGIVYTAVSVYRFVIVVVIFFFVGYVLRCRIVANFQLIVNFTESFPQFFVIVTFFIINHVYIIILECYPGTLVASYLRKFRHYHPN